MSKRSRSRKLASDSSWSSAQHRSGYRSNSLSCTQRRSGSLSRKNKFTLDFSNFPKLVQEILLLIPDNHLLQCFSVCHIFASVAESPDFWRRRLGLLFSHKFAIEERDYKKIYQEMVGGMDKNLISAIILDYFELVQVLINFGASVNFSAGLPLRMAVYLGHKNIVKYLLSKGASVDPKDNVIAIIDQYSLFSEYLPDIVARSAAVAGLPIKLAAEQGHTDILEMLLRQNRSSSQRKFAEECKKHGCALICAVHHGHNAAVSLLLKLGSYGIDCSDGAPLGIAILTKNYNLTKNLLDYGANPTLFQVNFALDMIGSSPIVDLVEERQANYFLCF